MQKSLNHLDNEERSRNLIINGLPEADIYLDDDPEDSLTNDEIKICHILDVMECKYFNQDMIKSLEIKRLGKQREGYNRTIKITCATKADRDEFVKNSKKLKEATDVFKKVYIKKDEHPVYVAENTRLRKHFKQLKDLDENKGKRVVFKDGKISIDGSVVDKNTFFS